MERTATPSDVQRELNITDRTLRAWVAKGCPSEPAPPGRGRPGRRFNVAEVRAWAERNELGQGPGGGSRPDERLPPAPGSTPNPSGGSPAAAEPAPATAEPSPVAIAKQQLLEQRVLKEAALVRQQELKFQKAAGAVVPVEEVRSFWVGQVANVHAHFQTLPGRLAPKVVDLTIEEAHELIEQELGRILEAFASGEPPTGEAPVTTRLEPQEHGGALLRYESGDEAG